MKYLLSIIILFSLTSVVHAGVTQRSPNNLGLVGYWSFDEGTSTMAGDSSGNKNSGSLYPGLSGTNTATSTMWTSGKRGKAMNFDGTDDYVELGNNAVTVADNLPWTFSTWVNVTAFTPGEYAGLYGNTLSSGQYERFQITSSLIIFEDSTNSGSGTTYLWNYSLIPGKWYHLSLVADGTDTSNLNLYVNGVSKGLVTSTNSKITVRKLGSRGSTSGHRLNGQIDDVRVYNRALSASEVLALYKSGEVVRRQANNTGLVGYWSFDEGTSTKAGDFSGNKNVGSLLGTNIPAWVNGKRGKALSFDGVAGDYVLVTDPPNGALDFGVGQNFSYSFWFKRNGGTSSAFLISKGSASTADTGYAFLLSSGNVLLAELSKPGEATRLLIVGPTVNDNNWHHLAVTHERTSNLTIYLDGISRTTGDISDYNVDLSNSRNFSIGAVYSGNGPFPGSMDDVRVYNRALSADEVYNLYKTGAVVSSVSPTTRLTDGLVGYWTFDGKDMQAYVADRSGQGNKGFLLGTATTTAVNPGKFGQALNLDGVNDYVAVGNPASLQIDTGTLSAWIKTKNAGASYRGIFAKNSAYGLYLYDNTLLFYDNGVPTGRGTGLNLADGAWHHVAVTFQSGVTNGTIIYSDGVAVLTTTETNTSQASSLAIGVGQGGVGQSFRGIIDDARIYNRILSASEIKQLYNMGK